MATMNLCAGTFHSLNSSPWNQVKDLGGELKRNFAAWRNRAHARRELMRLGDRELWDIGLTRVETARDPSKAVW